MSIEMRQLSHSLLCLCLLLIAGVTYSQSQFSRTFGQVNLHEMTEAQNGDLLISMSAIVSTNMKHGLLRLDKHGEQKWHFVYDDSGNSFNIRRNQVRESPSGAIYMSMYLDSAASKQSLLRLHPDGSLDWVRSDPTFITLHAASDGGVLACGNGVTATIVTKLDSTGAVEWSNLINIGYQGGAYSYKVLETATGYLLAGKTRPNQTPTSLYDLFAIKLDLQGNPVWAKKYGNSAANEEVEHATLMPDGGMLIEANIEDGSPSGDRESLLRVSPSGKLLWWKTFPSASNPYSLECSPQGTALFSVNTGGMFAGASTLMEIDSLGNMQRSIVAAFPEKTTVWPSSAGDFIHLGFGSFFLGSDPQVYRSHILGYDCNLSPMASSITDPPYISQDSILTTTTINNWVTPVQQNIPWVPLSSSQGLQCDSCSVQAAYASQANSGQVDFTDLSTGLVSEWLWDFGDGSLDSVQNPSHSYAASGQYPVCLFVTEGRCSDSICTVINVTLIGVEESLSDRIRISPNPSSGPLRIEFLNGLPQEKVEMGLYDSAGRRLSTRFSAYGQGYETDLSAFPNGLYLVSLKVGDQTWSSKVVVQR